MKLFLGVNTKLHSFVRNDSSVKHTVLNRKKANQQVLQKLHDSKIRYIKTTRYSSKQKWKLLNFYVYYFEFMCTTLKDPFMCHKFLILTYLRDFDRSLW